jgi:hypothetical protein
MAYFSASHSIQLPTMAKLHSTTHAQTQEDAPAVSFGALRAALVCLAFALTVLLTLYLFLTRASASDTATQSKTGAAGISQTTALRTAYC